MIAPIVFVRRDAMTDALTNLANRVQPLIRFDIGDRIRLPQRACACGSGSTPRSTTR